MINIPFYHFLIIFSHILGCVHRLMKCTLSIRCLKKNCSNNSSLLEKVTIYRKYNLFFNYMMKIFILCQFSPKNRRHPYILLTFCSKYPQACTHSFYTTLTKFNIVSNSFKSKIHTLLIPLHYTI
jgi:hypothetical protein